MILSLPLVVFLWNAASTNGSGVESVVDASKDIVIPDFSRVQRYFDNNSNPKNHNHHRHLEEPDEDEFAGSCEINFLSCLSHDKCVHCFKELSENDIDWGIVAPGTECPQIVSAIASKFDKCNNLKNDVVETKTFCETFDACVIYDQENIENDYDDDDDDEFADTGGDGDGDSDSDDEGDHAKMGCKKLTSCDWEGFKPSYIGDGICHEFIDGCYNTEICGYDGGDCCPSTCVNSTDYAGCGSDGYKCRDAKSPDCTEHHCKKQQKHDKKNDNKHNHNHGKKDNKHHKDQKPIAPRGDCTKHKSTFEMLKYSSFGDGWESQAEIKITKVGKDDPTYNGTLAAGSFVDSEAICLHNDEPTCFQVKVTGGSWGNDISWSIKPMSPGAREVASGESPMHCTFPVAGDKCENTCSGTSNKKIKKDNHYQSFDDLKKCMDMKCIIQTDSCSRDKACSPCLTDDTPAYCLANANYTALVFCTQCNCVAEAETPDRQEFCSAKSKKKHEDYHKNDEHDSKTSKCDSEQRKDGMAALQTYSECSNIEDKSMMTYFEFDNDNFGLLNKFEKCASEFLENRYTNSALDCLKILQEAIDNPAGEFDPIVAKDKKIPVEAIKQIANDLLHNGHDFCDCSSKATISCPACDQFIQFKTLLYESVDACNALDKIDCAAWSEFSKPCQENLTFQYKKVNFNDKTQCNYVRDGCGNVGPFPSFRQIDCSKEVSAESWSMYTDYKAKCMGDVAPKIKPVPSPPKPVPSPLPPYPKPTPKEYIPSNPDVDPTPSVLPGDSSSANKKYVPPEAEKKSYFFRKFIILGVVGVAGYWIYKRRTEFNYSSFRMSRTRNAYPYPTNGQEYGGDSEGMYDSLTMMDQSGGTSFQAPSLPPPPSAYSGAPPSTYDGGHPGAPPPNTGYSPHPYGGSA